jgi:predicted dehydrogenase
MNVIKLVIAGTGSMAHSHAKAFSAVKGCKLVAACDVVRERAQTFADKHDIPKVYGDIDEILAQSKMVPFLS